MPNWVFSQLYVQGSKKELTKFKEYAKGKRNDKEEVLHTDNFIPYPEHFKLLDKINGDFMLKDEERQKIRDSLTPEEKKKLTLLEIEGFDLTRDGFNQGGYDWTNENWGTKWGICDSVLEDEGEELYYSFQTAWGCCEPVIKKMSEMFPKLTFSYNYEEEGVAFAGVQDWKAGKIIHEEDRTAEAQQEREDEDDENNEESEE